MLYCRQDGQVFKLNQISVEYHCEDDVLFSRRFITVTLRRLWRSNERTRTLFKLQTMLDRTG